MPLGTSLDVVSRGKAWRGICHGDRVVFLCILQNHFSLSLSLDGRVFDSLNAVPAVGGG
jgi:hypothetical protein